MRVAVIGSEGFIGQALVRRILDDATIAGQGPVTQLVRLDTHMPADAGAEAGAPPVQRCLAGDLCDAALLAQAFAGGIDCVFHLASIAGGAAERDFALGLRVNLLGTVALLEALRAQGEAQGSCPRLVFASTIAVYGVPLPEAIDEQTVPVPSLSYGAHKYASEVLISDYARRGFVDGLSLRLPGVVARPPTQGMLSIFLSDAIRALAAGESFTCPVAADGPSWWMSRPCVVDNLLHAASLHPDTLATGRSFLLPVLRLTMAQVVQAVAEWRGPDVLGRVTYAPDAKLQAQFASYPPLHAPRAEAAGFRHDGDAATLVRRALQ